MTWHKATTIDAIPEGSYIALDIADESILLFKLDNGFYALKNQCTHQEAPLEGGEVEDGEIVCPLHGARFCIKTGAVTMPPAYEDVETYATKIEGNDIFVKID